MDHWRADLPVAVHEVDYEDTVTDLEPVARRLLAACGLDWDPACLEFHRTARPVRTASLTQVRQPLYTSSVARWKHYEGALDGLLAALPSEGAASGTLTRRRGERGGSEITRKIDDLTSETVDAAYKLPGHSPSSSASPREPVAEGGADQGEPSSTVSCSGVLPSP